MHWQAGSLPLNHLGSPKNTGAGSHSLIKGSSWPRDQPPVSHTASGFFTVWATRKPGLRIKSRCICTDFCWWPSISFPLALRTAFDTHILLPEEPALLDRSFSTHIFPSLLLAHFSSSSSYILILESSPLPLGSDLAPRHFSIQIHIGTFIILSQFMVMQMLCMLQPPHLCLHSGSSTWPLELEAKYIKANGDFFLVKIFFWCGSFLKSLLNLLQYGFR